MSPQILQFNKSNILKIGAEVLIVVAILMAVKMYQQRHLVEGDAPPLSGAFLSGQSLDLADYRGKPVLPHFWATWCSICKLEEASIAAISQDHAVITVAMNSGDSLAIQTYLHETGIRFPTIVDEHGILAQRFGVQAVPTSFVINSMGEIVFTEVGYTTNWGLRLRLSLAE